MIPNGKFNARDIKRIVYVTHAGKRRARLGPNSTGQATRKLNGSSTKKGRQR